MSLSAPAGMTAEDTDNSEQVCRTAHSLLPQKTANDDIDRTSIRCQR
jgi:hypothetical protein